MIEHEENILFVDALSFIPSFFFWTYFGLLSFRYFEFMNWKKLNSMQSVSKKKIWNQEDKFVGIFILFVRDNKKLAAGFGELDDSNFVFESVLS